MVEIYIYIYNPYFLSIATLRAVILAPRRVYRWASLPS
jgi:hypothetical protein